MRISKLIALTGTVVFCAGSISVHAADADNAAQAAARAAVLAAMQDANVPTVNPAPAAVQPARRVAVFTPVADNAAQAAALAAVKQALRTMNVRVGAAATMPAAPALPITARVADQLQALDARYQANQITPLDYFNQREALLKNQ